MKTNAATPARAAKITAALRAMKPDARPMMTNGFRAQSAAATAKGFYEITTEHGHAAYVSTHEATGWTRAPLTGSAICHRTYDSFTRPGERSTNAADQIFTAGKTYPAQGSVTGDVTVEGNDGKHCVLPNAAFFSYLRFV